MSTKNVTGFFAPCPEAFGTSIQGVAVLLEQRQRRLVKNFREFRPASEEVQPGERETPAPKKAQEALPLPDAQPTAPDP